MKTVRERDDEYSKGQEEVRKINSARMEAKLAYLEGLPEASNESAMRTRAAVKFGSRKLINTACDECGAALSEGNPNVGTSTGYGPASYPAACPGCGWAGNLLEYCFEEWKGEEE